MIRISASVATLEVIVLSLSAPIPTAGAGELLGRVRLRGDSHPDITWVVNATDPDVCGRRQSLEDFLVSPAEGGVANVIVALKDVPREKIPSLSKGRLVLDNRDCRFVPHASVLTVGSEIVTVNSDAVLHTTHFYGALEANLALPFKGVALTRKVERAGMIAVKCDVHGWMQAFVRVDPHPFHAVTAADGSFRIRDVPEGRYTLVAWHEKLGETEAPIEIVAGKTAGVELEYDPPAGR